MFNIYIKDENRVDEEVATGLSYGELIQYLLDCYREIKNKEELKDIEDGLYKDEEFILSVVETETYIDFDSYMLKIKKDEE